MFSTKNLFALVAGYVVGYVLISVLDGIVSAVRGGSGEVHLDNPLRGLSVEVPERAA